MIRVVLEEGLLFLLPFAAFALLLALGRQNPFRLESWSRRAYWLTAAGFVCVLAGFVATALFVDHDTGPFTPAHVVNGVVVPGRVR